MSQSICVIGLGLMGRPIARRLAANGFDVSAWNRSALAAELTEGIALARDLAEAAAADNVKRVIKVTADEASPYLITAFMEMKTVWHPIGV